MKSGKRRWQDPRKKWVPLVGKFVLFFGDIENVTYLALRQLPKDRIFRTTATLGFSKRVDLVIELISDHAEIDGQLSERFIEKLKAAKKLSETRNLVAHSPVVMKVYHHPKEGWTHHEIALASARSHDQELSLTDLRKAVAESEKLAKVLYTLYGKIHRRVVKP
jgi:hypothetical protein